MINLYEPRNTPLVQAVQVKIFNDSYLEELLLGTEYKLESYNSDPYMVKIGNEIINENDYVVLTDYGLEFLKEIEFLEKYKPFN